MDLEKTKDKVNKWTMWEVLEISERRKGFLADIEFLRTEQRMRLGNWECDQLFQCEQRLEAKVWGVFMAVEYTGQQPIAPKKNVLKLYQEKAS